jgi:hypothetical protein
MRHGDDPFESNEAGHLSLVFESNELDESNEAGHLPARVAWNTVAESLDEVVGPEIKWMRAAVFAMIAMQVGLFFFVKAKVVTCPPDGVYPTYDNRVFILALPVIAFRSYVEWRALKRYLPTYVNIVRSSSRRDFFPFKALGKPTNFYVWFAFYGMCTNLNIADVSTDSLQAATAMKATECPGNDPEKNLEKIWAITMQQSIFGWLGFPAPFLKLENIVVFVWAVSLVQMVYPLLQTAGRNRCRRERVGDNGEDTRLLSGEPVFNIDKFGELTEAAGMATFQSVVVTASHVHMYKTSGRLLEPAGLLAYAAPLLRQMVSRFVLCYFLETCLQLNLQTSLFAISFYLDHDPKAHIQMLGSLTLSLGLTLLKLVEAKSCYDVTRAIDNAIASGEATGFRDSDMSEDLWNKNLGTYRRCKRIIAISCIVLVLSLAYATCKLLAVFVCKDSMLNMTGCVQL